MNTNQNSKKSDLTRRDDALLAENARLRKRVAALERQLATHAVCFELEREREWAEKALHKSEERYRSIITTMHEGVILHDQDGAIREWNHRAREMLGRTTEKLLGLAPGDTHWQAIQEDGTPFDGRNHPSLVALRTGHPCSNVVMGIYKPDGTLTWLLVNARPLFDNHTSPPARPCGAVTTFIDITERKQAEDQLTAACADLETVTAQLRRSRDLLRTLFDGLPDGLVLLDNEGRVLAINQAIAALLGRTVKPLLNRFWIDICQEASPPFPCKVVFQTLTDGVAHRQRERYVPPSSAYRSSRILDIQTLPIMEQPHAADPMNRVNQIDQVVVHVVDVTEQLTMETIAIQNERLAASGTLAATVAHEINTPLQSINHCLFLAYDLTDPQRDTYLTMARDEIARISRIVRQLLDFHRPAASPPAPFDVNLLLDRVLNLTGGTLARNRITVVRNLTPNLPPLWGRADQITQVFMNLVLNAQKAMPDGGELRVCTMTMTMTMAMAMATSTPGSGAERPANQPPSPPWLSGEAPDRGTATPPYPGLTAVSPLNHATDVLVVHFEDTGVGMSPEVQARIFDSFFTTGPGGSGLGLTISQKIMTYYGGYIGVQSVPGQGSTFSVVFPLPPGEPGAYE